ncbi:hypothetical protein M3Y97_01133300 [Aphelenchoides bicaudatus]|nr:hypothetical protein M3Y97_01133300 [Aphelenchoides bicaudatus]
MPEIKQFLTTPVMQKISRIYAYILLAWYVIGIAIMVRFSPHSREIPYRLQCASIFTCIIIFLVISLIGETCKRYSLMMPNLVIQFFVTILVVLSGLIAIVNAIYHLVWIFIQADTDEYYWLANVFEQGIFTACFCFLFAILNGVFGFYLPSERYKQRRIEQKNEENFDKQMDQRIALDSIS